MPTRCRSSTRRLDREVERVADRPRRWHTARQQPAGARVLRVGPHAAGRQRAKPERGRGGAFARRRWPPGFRHRLGRQGRAGGVGSQPRARLHPHRPLSFRARRRRIDIVHRQRQRRAAPRGRTRPTTAFPPNDKLRGAYSVVADARQPPAPRAARRADARGDDDDRCMRANGLVGSRVTSLVRGALADHATSSTSSRRTAPTIRCSATCRRAGDGAPADGEPSLAIFGSGDAARAATGAATVHRAQPPRARAPLRALRSLLRELRGERRMATTGPRPPSPATTWTRRSAGTTRAAGRTYDYEGFNRLPDYEPAVGAAAAPARCPLTAARRGRRSCSATCPISTDRATSSEPESLYLWDAAAKAGVSYRSYGEFVGTHVEPGRGGAQCAAPKTLSGYLAQRSLPFRRKRALEGASQHDVPCVRHDRRPMRSRRTAIVRRGRAAMDADDPRASTPTRDSAARRASARGSTSSSSTSRISDAGRRSAARARRSCGSPTITPTGWPRATRRRSS